MPRKGPSFLNSFNKTENIFQNNCNKSAIELDINNENEKQKERKKNYY